jgi:prepilin-type N-terminal cleavage/methylation domain-containing protein
MSFIKNSENGFTIIELMIATAVLSTILVLVTTVMVNIGTLYYKGINQSRIQDDVRSITDDIVHNIQLDDQPPKASSEDGPHGEQAFCVGNVRYTYILGVQIGHPASHVLWRDQNPTPGSCTPVDLTDPTGGNEMIASNSRLTMFSVSTTNPPYTVTVGAAYGDDDLLTGTTGDVHCKGQKGDQFCATAHLTASAVQRVAGGSF